MICICDYRTPASVLGSLKKEFEVVQLPLDARLPAPVWGHSDLLVFILGKFLITRSSYYRIAKREIEYICKKAGLILTFSDSEAGNKYPDDCGFCAAISGKKLICRKASTDGEILYIAKKSGYTVVDVPQGYARCSCACLADGALITSDKGIARQTLKSGIETLLISEGHVDLPGYSYGFIGGATGLCDNVLYFCGDLKKHPDCEAIIEFAHKHNTECISLSGEKLYDVGTLIFIKKQA